MPEIDLPREDYRLLVERIQRSVGCNLGCLAVGDEGAPTISRAAVGFVSRGAEKYLVTAKHVLDGLWQKAELLRVLRASSSTKASVPSEHVLGRSALVWQSELLDVAVLRAPATLASLPGVGWFSADRGARQVTKLRQEWNPDSAPTLTLATGFPNFGRIAGTLHPGLRAELLGMLTLPATIAHLKKSPDECSHMFLELTHADPMIGPDADRLTRALYGVLTDNPPTKTVDLGGLSGGPLILPAADGDAEIVGIISEGSIMETDGDSSVSILRVTPIDQVIFSS